MLLELLSVSAERLSFFFLPFILIGIQVISLVRCCHCMLYVLYHVCVSSQCFFRHLYKLQEPNFFSLLKIHFKFFCSPKMYFYLRCTAILCIKEKQTSRLHQVALVNCKWRQFVRNGKIVFVFYFAKQHQNKIMKCKANKQARSYTRNARTICFFFHSY